MVTAGEMGMGGRGYIRGINGSGGETIKNK